MDVNSEATRAEIAEIVSSFLESLKNVRTLEDLAIEIDESAGTVTVALPERLPRLEAK